ncbi:MAG: hypothetical protein HY092_02680 [Candidatus Kerfeldbacteria bacterium]|nr:hypothetical protein [Candidatus Kerfeldbacteria bacterium]
MSQYIGQQSHGNWSMKIVAVGVGLMLVAGLAMMLSFSHRANAAFPPTQKQASAWNLE